jgi:hypothetical protein
LALLVYEGAAGKLDIRVTILTKLKGEVIIMFKKIIATVVVLSVIISSVTAFAATELPAPVKGQMMIDVIVNGQKVKFPDTEPFIDANSRTMVPVRFVSEKLGAAVTWDIPTQTATIKYGTKEIIMPVNSKVVKVDGVDITLDTEAVLTEGRTMVPLRFVSEALGSKIVWDASANSVQVSDVAYLAKVANGSVKLDPWGRQISDKVSTTWNMLTDIPDYAYGIPTNETAVDSANDNNINFFKNVPQWTSKESIDLWSNRIRKYYTAALNVDYRTIDSDTFVKALEDNMQFASSYFQDVDTKAFRAYVQFVKDNHIITTGYADPETDLVRYESARPIMRTHFKFNVIQSDNKTQTIFDSYDLSEASDTVKLDFNHWYDGYADIVLYTNSGNQQEKYFGVGYGENMFIKNQYKYLETK